MSRKYGEAKLLTTHTATRRMTSTISQRFTIEGAGGAAPPDDDDDDDDRAPSVLEFTITAPRIAAPEIAICQNGETSIIGSELRMITRNAAPSRQPSTRPLPPAVLTP